MKLTMVGTGYVGLVSGACFAETGADVTCADVDAAKLATLRSGKIPIAEPGLPEMVARNVAAGRLVFTADVPGAIREADVVFIAVGTPRRSDGAADLQAVDRVAEMVAANASHETVLVLKSTVPVGTNARVRRLTKDAPHRVHVVSNPEFLKEGDAINDFMKPDRIVIGCDEDDEFAHDLMERVYHPVSLSQDRIIWMDPQSAELTKYVSNTMLAMRISFMNEIAALCEKVGADVHLVRRGVGSDERIGSKFLHAGPGYGGSCLDGRETVLVRDASGAARLVRLEDLFEERASGAGAAEGPVTAVSHPDDLQVLAWRPRDRRPSFERCAVLTRRPYEGEMIHVTTKMGRRLRCTADHPLVVLPEDGEGASRVVLARELTTSDWLPLALAPDEERVEPSSALDMLSFLGPMGIAPREVIARLDEQDARRVRELGTSDVADRIASLAHPRGRARAYDLARTPTPRVPEAEVLGLSLAEARLGTARNGTWVPRTIPLDERFWRVLGLYLAEGHCTVDGRRHRLAWSFHPTAEGDLVDEVAGYFRSLDVRCDVRRASTTMQVSVSSRLLARLFLRVLRVGADCYEHRLPDEIWAAPSAHRWALLSGLWHGDGSWSLVNRGPSVVLEYGTVSRGLADGVLRLLALEGIVARLKIARMSKSTRDTYFLSISGADQVEQAAELIRAPRRAEALASVARQTKRIASTGYRRIGDGTALVRVTNVERRPYQGYVYSLEVPEAGTVVTTGGLVVHNCFPKDVGALVHTGHDHGIELELAAATERVNHRQKGILLRKLRQQLGGELRGRRIAVWGLAFKPQTDDIRESPALQLIDVLLSEGAEVRAHDPWAMENVRALYGDRITLAKNGYEAAAGADALVLVTEWRQYQNPDFQRLKATMREARVLDGRNIWSGYGLRKLGFVYEGIGTLGS